MSKEIIELVAAFGTFYLAVMGVLVPVLLSTRKAAKKTHTELKADIGKLETKIDKETSGLRTEMRAELRAINDRLDGTNMRIDRLVDALLTAPEKVS